MSEPLTKADILEIIDSRLNDRFDIQSGRSDELDRKLRELELLIYHGVIFTVEAHAYARIKELLASVIVRQGELHIDENKRIALSPETATKLKDALEGELD